MASQRVDVDHPEAAGRALGGAEDPSQVHLVVTISTSVPDWLPDVVARVRQAGATVSVRLAPDGSIVTPDGLAGWEIGVLTSVLSLGIHQVEGADPARVARVRAVVDALDEAAPREGAR